MPGANPAVARATLDAIAGPTEVVEVEGGHFGLMFDPSEQLDAALRVERSFLRKHLGLSPE